MTEEQRNDELIEQVFDTNQLALGQSSGQTESVPTESSHVMDYSEEWDDLDWDCDLISLQDDGPTEEECLSEEQIEKKASIICNPRELELRGNKFSIRITQDVFPTGCATLVSENDDEFWIQVAETRDGAPSELLQACYELTQFQVDSVGNLAQLLESFGISELYWGIYWSSAYSCTGEMAQLTRWIPVWDDEVQAVNCRCFLLQHNSGIGMEFFIYPYASCGADCLHILFPRTSQFDESSARNLALGIAKAIELHHEETNEIDSFLDSALTQKIDSELLASTTEALTSIFIELQNVVVAACLSRASCLEKDAVDSGGLSRCFDGIVQLHLKAIAYLRHLLDIYEAQVSFGASVSERSEALSFIGAFDGNLLPEKSLFFQNLPEQLLPTLPPNELLDLRARLERYRWQLRNNPDGTSEDEQYAANAEASVSRIQIGDEFDLGRYFWANEEDLRPISWMVVGIKGTHALCISKHQIDCQYFNEFEGDVTWETSTIRDWLNNEFASIAFTADDRKMISGAKLDNEPNKEYGTSGGSTTRDRIFLLSEQEASALANVPNGDDPSPTPFAESRGASQWWWLRSPGHRETHVAYASSQGSVNTAGTKACLLARGIRPAFYLKIAACESVLFSPKEDDQND